MFNKLDDGWAEYAKNALKTDNVFDGMLGTYGITFFVSCIFDNEFRFVVYRFIQPFLFSFCFSSE